MVELWGLDGNKDKLASLKGFLDPLLSNGGCLVAGTKDSTFVVPSYNCLSEKEKALCEESGCGIVAAGGTNLRQSPDLNAGKKGTLAGNEILISYADTLCDEHFSNCTWRKVSRANGEQGFLLSTDVQTKSDGYIRIVKEKEGWKIRVLKGRGIPTDDT